MTHDSWKARDRSLEEMGPDPDDELRAEEAYWDSYWEALEEFTEEFMPAMIDEEM